MLGRDLIIYILDNDLVDKPVFEDGRILGLMTDEEAAVKFRVTKNTIELWVRFGHITGITIGGQLYIPANTESPVKGDLHE